MKGQATLPEDIGWTIFIVIIVLFVSIISLLLIASARAKGSSPIFYTLEFVNLAAKPYLVGESLSFYQIEDRQFFEHALESSIVNSVEKASSQGMPAKLKIFVDAYEFKRYFIDVKSAKGNILELTNSIKRCGSDGDKDNFPDGMCLNRFFGDYSKKYGACGIGRSEIPDAGQCRFYQTCCKEDASYSKPDTQVVRCGQGKGICSADLSATQGGISLRICDEGRVYYPDDKACENSNLETPLIGSGFSQTPICCVPINPENLVSSDLSVTAQVPLFFNNTYGSIEVTIG